MPDKKKRNLKERFNRLKKALKKALSAPKENATSKLILQPYNNKQRVDDNITRQLVRLRV